MNPTRLPSAVLRSFAARLFEAWGANSEHANLVADNLVESSLLGHDSHGILRIARYIEKIERGELDPTARPSVQQSHGATAVIDGHQGFGAVTAGFGVHTLLQRIHGHGIASVALSHTTHVGRLGHYAEQISRAGHIALLFASGAGPGGSVAAHGGCGRLFGTNPLAWALPTLENRPPLVADFSTAAIPEGKVAVARHQGAELPPGVLVDRDGQPSRDAAAYYAGGALLPFGGHKGSSLLLFIEVVANLLGHHVPASSVDYRAGNPTLLIAIDPDAFVPRETFQRYTEELLANIENSPPAAGFDRVRLPHAIETECRALRLREGIPVPDTVWHELTTLAGARQVPVPAR